MRLLKFISLALILVMASAFAAAQDKVAETPTTIKHVPITNVSPTSGKEMFRSYCATCHGTDAKGGGPAAPALKTPPPDLTVLAQKDGGKYPAAHVAAVIRGQATLASHGSQDMPLWGPLFTSVSQGHESEVQQRVSNLVEYIQTLQVK